MSINKKLTREQRSYKLKMETEFEALKKQKQELRKKFQLEKLKRKVDLRENRIKALEERLKALPKIKSLDEVLKPKEEKKKDYRFNSHTVIRDTMGKDAFKIPKITTGLFKKNKKEEDKGE